MSKTKQEIVEAVKVGGVIGAGGGGFPTYFKLDANVEIIIANGSECEPLLDSDKFLMRNNADLLIEGMKLAMAATGAKKGYVALKGYYKDVSNSVKAELKKHKCDIEVFEMDNYYPAGDEQLMVYDVTGRVVPEGGIPLSVGVLVSNVLSFAQIYHAVHGKPVTERVITITGAVNKPCVVNAPIGTSYQELIELAEGVTLKEDYVVIDGGPMMGNIVSDLTLGVAKTTSGIIVLPKTSEVLRAKQMSVAQMAKLSKAACCNCQRCTDLCSRNILGHSIYPHKTMRTIDYNLSNPTDHITSAFLCSQCGLCELVGCDIMRLSPRKIYAEYKKQLQKAGIKNPHNKNVEKVRDTYSYAKPSVPMIMQKLGLAKYYVKEGLPPVAIKTKKVRIPIKSHIGLPSEVVVHPGMRVMRCDVIAVAAKDKLGAFYHASIDGEVTEVNDNFIEIMG